MNYLQDKRSQKKKFSSTIFFVIFLLIVFYFRVGIFNKFSYVSNIVFRPVLVLGGNLGTKLGSVGSFFRSKSSLDTLNKNLQLELDQNKATMINYNTVLAENDSLKEILGRKKGGTNMLLAAILSKPNQSPYDTLVIDAGTGEGLQVGNTVFAFGNIPIGRVAETYAKSSKVVLFSNRGEKTQVVIGKDAFMEIVGRGGGNFEMIVPRDFVIQKGDQAVLPGINSYVVGIVETVLSDPRDSFQKALLVSPVNIQELKFVEVEK